MKKRMKDRQSGGKPPVRPRHLNIVLSLAAWLLLTVILAGCTGLTPTPGTPSLQTTLIPDVRPSPATPPVTPLPTPTGFSQPADPGALRLWVPPLFDPDSGTPAGKLLQERLAEFARRRPGAQVEVRVKSEDGPGGLYDSLSTASAAATASLPDLVALPYPLYQAAALKGLLRPTDELAGVMDDPDWYPYARDLANIQGSVFGLPFAGDALLMAIHRAQVAAPPMDWDSLLEDGQALAFPAADPTASFGLAQYLKLGGETSDKAGHPILAEKVLGELFEFLGKSSAAGVMPAWLAQLQSNEQAWDAFRSGRAPLLVTWASRFLQEKPDGIQISTLPTQDGEPFTLASGWLWAVASPDPERRMLAVQLAEFLSEGDFQAKWMEAAGYLPARPSSVAAWQDTEIRAALDSVASSAVLLPPVEVLNVLGPAIQTGIVRVLMGEADSASAAQDVLNRLVQP
jgi:ABC-type glycerol-3-phosphate transport system substrate-binding protein